MTDRDKYFDLLVIRIVSGDENSQWSKLVDFLMTADDVNYAKVARAYPELINAINRYNESHKGFVETKLQRKGK